jgi:hypothetical protein
LFPSAPAGTVAPFPAGIGALFFCHGGRGEIAFLKLYTI